jgi:hypothetical protein
VNLAAWIMPGFALLVGLLLIVHYAGHWTAKKKIATAQPGLAVDSSVRERIERELSGEL